MKWWAYLTGILGTAGLASLALIPGAAGIINAVTGALGPIFKGLAELLVWFVKTMWEGIVDIVDNIATIVTVITLVAGFSFYYKYYSPERKACENEIVLMKKQIDSLKAKVKANGR